MLDYDQLKWRSTIFDMMLVHSQIQITKLHLQLFNAFNGPNLLPFLSQTSVLLHHPIITERSPSVLWRHPTVAVSKTMQASAPLTWWASGGCSWTPWRRPWSWTSWRSSSCPCWWSPCGGSGRCLRPERGCKAGQRCRHRCSAVEGGEQHGAVRSHAAMKPPTSTRSPVLPSRWQLCARRSVQLAPSPPSQASWTCPFLPQRTSADSKSTHKPTRGWVSSPNPICNC